MLNYVNYEEVGIIEKIEIKIVCGKPINKFVIRRSDEEEVVCVCDLASFGSQIVVGNCVKCVGVYRWYKDKCHNYLFACSDVMRSGAYDAPVYKLGRA